MFWGLVATFAAVVEWLEELVDQNCIVYWQNDVSCDILTESAVWQFLLFKWTGAVYRRQANLIQAVRGKKLEKFTWK